MSTTTAPTAPTVSPSQTAQPKTHGGLLASAASPALILAFLAIGIFAGGFVCLTLMRRFGMWNGAGTGRRGVLARRDARDAAVRGWAANVAAAEIHLTVQPSRRSVPALVKPQFWDVGTRTRPIATKAHDVQWAGLEPLALSYTRPLSSTHAHTYDSTHALALVDPPPPRRRLCLRLRSFFRWLNILRASPPDAAHQAGHDAQLHLAVAIAMPTQRRAASAAALPAYELGLAQLAWAEGTLDRVVDAVSADTEKEYDR